MSSFYRIKGLPGLDGLVVESETVVANVALVSALLNPTSMLGDRDLRFPMPEHAIAISTDFLVEIPNPSKEYTTKNPFGKHLYEGRFKRDTLEIVTVEFENAITVTIIERNPPQNKGVDHTIYTQNFFESKKAVKEVIEDVLQNVLDPDDLIFALGDIKSREDKANG